MDGFLGADIADLRDFAKTMDKASHALIQQAQALSSAVNQSHGWRGPDAERFRQTWNSSHRPAIAATSRSLQEAADLLRRNAQEQETASSVGSMDGSGPGSGGNTDDKSFIAKTLDFLGLGGKAIGIALGIKGFISNFREHATFLAGKQWKQFGQAYNAFKTFQAEGGLLGKLGATGQFLGKAGKLIGAFGRFAGPLLAPLGIYSGIRDMIDPGHDGWRGVGDRIAGGLGVIGAAGSILIAVGAVANPVGIAVLVGAGVIAGGWALGNMIADSEWGKAAGKWIGDKATEGWNHTTAAVGNVVDGAKNAVSGAVDGAKDFLSNPVKSLGGLFA
ncbi:WXG100 family type VII secretion target [Arthrobacter sp. TWP1-1]|uniref:WXG100 family type VII secretion target n=1 Tax=Arthrobacter sp. TWP1-1 TaxID=2804568 RepID=UPI003CE9D682